MQARVESGLLSCPRFGNITGIDCSCLRDIGCSGCFIFNATQPLNKVKNTPVSLEGVINFNLSNKDLNPEPTLQ